jgi:hypothetical protein
MRLVHDAKLSVPAHPAYALTFCTGSIETYRQRSDPKSFVSLIRRPGLEGDAL